MKIVKTTTDFSYHGRWYDKGENITLKTVEELIALNEKGFIEPQTMKDIENFGKQEPKFKEKTKEE